MRLFISLICCTLLFSASSFGSSLKRVRLNKLEIKRLTKITAWLDKNLDAAECPYVRYFSVYRQNPAHATFTAENFIESEILLGYEVQARCPETPTPRIVLRFDIDQAYIEK